MTPAILRALNTPLLILFTLVGIAIQTSLFHYYPLMYLQPDVVLIVTIWCGLRRPLLEGGIIALIIANAAEIHSSAPQGLFLVTYMAIYLGIRGLSRIALIPRLSSLVVLTLFTTLFWKFLQLIVLYLMNHSTGELPRTLALIPFSAVMEGVVAIWLYRWLDRFDRVTFKDPKARADEDNLLTGDEWL